MPYNLFFHEKSFAHRQDRNMYSWIAQKLQDGLTLAFLLWRSDIKTSFEFLSANYTGHFTCFLVKAQNEFFAFFVTRILSRAKKWFPGGLGTVPDL